MSVIKRILEANKFSKHLPEEWIDKEYREKHSKDFLSFAVDMCKPAEFNDAQKKIIVYMEQVIKPKQSGKKTDENQLSLF